MALKTLRIKEETHTRLKVFCAKHRLKINTWTDMELNTILAKLEKKDAKKIDN